MTNRFRRGCLLFFPLLSFFRYRGRGRKDNFSGGDIGVHFFGVIGDDARDAIPGQGIFVLHGSIHVVFLLEAGSRFHLIIFSFPSFAILFFTILLSFIFFYGWCLWGGYGSAEPFGPLDLVIFENGVGFFVYFDDESFIGDFVIV